MARHARLIALSVATAAILIPGHLDHAAVNAADATTLIAAGNIGDCSSEGDEATAAIVEHLDGIVAALGDLAYPSGSAASFGECYDPGWGQFRDRTRPVPGNHDYETGGATSYFTYFGEAAGDPDRGYYSYSLGSWHVVALNSVCEEVECASESEQMAWLRGDLGAAAADCVLAYWHHPRFSSGSVGSDPRMAAAWRILQEAGAEVVISGHSHHYERFAPQDHRGTGTPDGIRQFVVGTGGTDLHPVASRLLTSEALIGERHGVLRLELEEASYRWQFLAVGAQEALDEGVGECRGRPVQFGSMFRTLAPMLIILPVVFTGLIVLLVRLSSFRVH